MVESELLGMAKEINSASVKMVDAANERSRSHDRSSYNENNREWHGGQYGAIDALPDEGKVTITGQVASVDHDDPSFTLRDNTDETIDVHTSQRLNVSRGGIANQ